MVVVTNSEENIQFNLNILQDELEKIVMVINTGKTKSVVIANSNKTRRITLREKVIEQVKVYKHLAAVLSIMERWK